MNKVKVDRGLDRLIINTGFLYSYRPHKNFLFPSSIYKFIFFLLFLAMNTETMIDFQVFLMSFLLARFTVRPVGAKLH